MLKVRRCFTVYIWYISSRLCFGLCFRQVNKRFQRLESHVVTLARSVAHLSSEMRSQATLNTDMDEIKQDIKRLKEVVNSRGPNRQAYLNEFERFRGWVPSLSNPRRVNKLTK